MRERAREGTQTEAGAEKRASGMEGYGGYTRSPSQDSRLEYFRHGLGCSEIDLFIGSG